MNKMHLEYENECIDTKMPNTLRNNLNNVCYYVLTMLFRNVNIFAFL